MYSMLENVGLVGMVNLYERFFLLERGNLWFWENVAITTGAKNSVGDPGETCGNQLI